MNHGGKLMNLYSLNIIDLIRERDYDALISLLISKIPSFLHKKITENSVILIVEFYHIWTFLNISSVFSKFSGKGEVKVISSLVLGCIR